MVIHVCIVYCVLWLWLSIIRQSLLSAQFHCYVCHLNIEAFLLLTIVVAITIVFSWGILLLSVSITCEVDLVSDQHYECYTEANPVM